MIYKISQQHRFVPLGRWAAAGDGDELCWIAHGSESMSKKRLVCSKGYQQCLGFGVTKLAVVPLSFSYVGSCFYCFRFS